MSAQTESTDGWVCAFCSHPNDFDYDDDWAGPPPNGEDLPFRCAECGKVCNVTAEVVQVRFVVEPADDQSDAINDDDDFEGEDEDGDFDEEDFDQDDFEDDDDEFDEGESGEEDNEDRPERRGLCRCVFGPPPPHRTPREKPVRDEPSRHRLGADEARTGPPCLQGAAYRRRRMPRHR